MEGFFPEVAVLRARAQVVHRLAEAVAVGVHLLSGGFGCRSKLQKDSFFVAAGG